jgi:GTPase SAR1 family protein
MEAFFKPETQVKDIKSIEKLTVDNVKSFDDSLVEYLHSLKINKIKDLISSKIDDLADKLQESGFPKETVDYVVISTKIMKKLIEVKSKDQAAAALASKIAFMGMQNAGKTTMINFLFSESPDDKFKDASPTVSVENKTVKLGDYQLAIWDFGGQESFRKEYLANPDEYLLNTGLLVFVVDTQDDSMYADAIDYLNSVLGLLNITPQELSIIIDLHKYDPDLLQDVDYLVKVQWLEEKFKEILGNYPFPYEFMRTSIFSEAGVDSEIAKNLKDLFTVKDVDKERISQLSLLKNLLFTQVKIYINLMTVLSDISGSIKSMQVRAGAGLGALPPSTFPPPPKPEEHPFAGEISPSNLVSELREIFKKKKLYQAGT